MRVESNISRNAPADGQQEHWDGEASTGHVSPKLQANAPTIAR